MPLLSSERKTIREMFAALKKRRKIYHPSKYWEVLNKKNMQQLEENGFESIKIKQAFDYFTWTVFTRKHDQFAFIWSKSNFFTKLKAIFCAFFSKSFTQFPMKFKSRLQYTVYIILLWEYVKQFDTHNLSKLEEPALGNGLTIQWQNKKISQDLANSILETISITEVLPFSKRKLRIMELGGGYGRNAYVLLQCYSPAQYIMVDIPPALAISQWYLSKIFSNKKIFKFRDFKSYEEVAAELKTADIIFLLPHQMEMLPDKSIDLFVNISSLHEMRLDQIKAYMQEINRLVKGIFYMKEWKESKIPYENIIITSEDYPIPPKWKKLFKREARVQTQFFEATYKIM